MHVDSYQEIQQKEIDFKVKKALLGNLHNATIWTYLFDSHIYYCKKEVLDLILWLDEKNQGKLEMESWKFDFLPFLITN